MLKADEANNVVETFNLSVRGSLFSLYEKPQNVL